MILLLWACASNPAFELRLLDESGAPTRGWVESAGRRLESDGAGVVRLDAPDHPLLVFVGGDDVLTEPVALGPEELAAPVEVRLWDEDRVAMHFGGDVMLGRRYLAPTDGSAPLLPADDRAGGARAVLSDLSELFRVADLSVANAESVIVETTHTEPMLDASLPNTPTDALPYPGKRWVLQTPPEAAEAAFDALDLDFLAMGNNHQYDWEEFGLASALAALGCEVPDVEDRCVGAGMSEEEALLPGIRRVGGMLVGMLALTTVDGDWVNDNYPTDPEDAPPELPWAGQPILWGEPELGVPVEARLIGAAWAEIRAIEAGLDEDDRAALWSSARAAYPGLQDWVARRGHGGAATFAEGDPARLAAEVTALRPEVDLLIVQLHMGYQFSEQPGLAVRAAARAAIDAGADLVIGHHPHVLQGVEWYKGRLIAYSLGNLVFDQDFLSTFPSVVLRTVFDRDGALLEARLLPLWLDDYRPVPTVGDRARTSLAAMWESSLIAASSDRGSDGAVRAVPDAAPSVWPRLRFERGSARVEAVDGPIQRDAWRSFTIPEQGVAPIFGEGLVLAGAGAPGQVQLGRALLRLGDFEDLDTDHDAAELDGWVGGGSADLSITDEAALGAKALELVRSPGDQEALYARTAARATFAEHRLWSDADGGEGLDGEASYTARLWAWLEGEPGRARLRLDLYHFDDLDPTVEPESALVRSVELPLSIPEAGWQPLDIALDEALFAPQDGLIPNAALLYVFLDPPEHSVTVLRIDAVELIEWRDADAGPERAVRADYVRGAPGELELPILAW